MKAESTVFNAALENGDLCGGLWIMKDAITDANLACQTNNNHTKTRNNSKLKPITNYNKIDPKTVISWSETLHFHKNKNKTKINDLDYEDHEIVNEKLRKKKKETSHSKVRLWTTGTYDNTCF